MKENEHVCELYAVKNKEGDSFFMRAFLYDDGSLTLEGQDFGKFVERAWGSDEYEYWYKFDVENTNKIKKLLKTDDLFKGLKDFFKGENKAVKFREFLEKNDVKWKFDSWVS